MAPEPGDMNPQPAQRRSRRERRHLDLAAASAEPMTADEPAKSEPSDARRPAPRSKRTRGLGAALQGNVRVVVAVAFFVIGVVLVLLGWYGAAHTNILTEQIPYLISGGLLGMALIIVAGVVASSASLERDNQEIRRDIGRAMAGGPERFRAVRGPAGVADGDDDAVYVVPGGRSFHTAGCPIVEGKDATEMTLDDATEAGFTTCKLCGPD